MMFFTVGAFMMCAIYFEWNTETEVLGILGYIFCAIWMLIGVIQMKIDELIETIKNKG